MHRILAALLMASSLGLAAQAPLPVVKVTGISPESPAALPGQRPLYVRVEYQSDQPLRLQAAGYWHGQKRARYSVNPSPVYAAGSGEAVVWFAADTGAQIDELSVVVSDRNWQPLTTVSVPVQAAWHANAPEAAPAAWVQTLSAAQQRATSQQLQQSTEEAGGSLWGTLVGVLMPLVFLSVPGYPLLQLYAFYRLRGPRRLLSALPLAFMLPVYAFCIYALSRGSNLWPLYAIFASPVALLIVWGVLWFNRRNPAEPPPV